MRRRLILLLAFLGAARAENLVRNPCFAGLPPWTVTRWSRQQGKVSLPGSRLLIINDQARQYTMVEQTVGLRPRTGYVLTFRIKGDAIQAMTDSRESGAYVMILNQGEFVFMGSPAGRWQAVQGTFDWRKCRLEFRTGELQGVSSLYLVLNKSIGQVEFTEVVLENLSAVHQTAQGSLNLVPACWQDDRWHLAEDLPGSLYCDLRIDCRRGAAYELEVDLPRGIQLLQALPWILRGAGFKADPIVHAESPRGDGFRSHRVTLPRRYLDSLHKNRLDWMNYYRLVLQGSDTRSGGRGIVRLLEDGRAALERQVLLQVLPPIVYPRNPLQRFGLQICYLYCLTLPDPSIRDRRLDFWLNLARRPETFTVFRFDRLASDLQERVRRQFQPNVFLSFVSLPNWRKKQQADIPESCFIDGRTSWQVVCPSFMESRGTVFWEDYVASLIEKRLRELPEARRIVWDFEPGAERHCYCPTCRRRFSASIQAKGCLTAEEIRSRHAAEWFRFRVRQHGVIVENFLELCHRRFPGRDAVLCTDPLHKSPPHLAAWCGVDCRLNDASCDMFMNMPYFQGANWFDDLGYNRRQLRKPNFPLIDPTEDMKMYYSRYTPAGVTQNIVAAAALGARGIGLWPGDNFDGRYSHAIAEGCRRVAEFEDFYCGSAVRADGELGLRFENAVRIPILDHGRTVEATIPDFAATTRSTVHRNGDERLATVFNYHAGQEMLVRISCPAANGCQVYSENQVLRNADLRKGFLACVPAGGVRQFLFTRRRRPAAGAVDAGRLERKAEDFHRFAVATPWQLDRRSGNASIRWGLLPDASLPMLKLTLENRSVYVDLKRQAAIAGYYVDAVEDILADAGRGVLDELNLYHCPAPLEFHLKKAEIRKGVPVVELSAEVPAAEDADPNSIHPAGLRIHKTLSLEDGGGTIRSVYRLVNPAGSQRRMQTGFRLKNHPRLGARWLSGRSPAELTTIALPLETGTLDFRGGSTADNLFLTKAAASPPGGLPGLIFKTPLLPEAMRYRTADGDQKIELDLRLFPETEDAGCFIWWNSNTYATLEPLTPERSLAPGEERTIISVIRLER